MNTQIVLTEVIHMNYVRSAERKDVPLILQFIKGL